MKILLGIWIVMFVLVLSFIRGAGNTRTIERRKYRGKRMQPCDTTFQRHRTLMTVLCVLFGAAFLIVALLSTVLGDAFVNTLFHSFGG
jgi:uncharacterized membrane protein YciS (DUF1049 family)